MEFQVYTDGSCKGNPGKGGYAYTVYDEDGEVWVKGRGNEKQTTNNRMELTAAIEALKTIDTRYQNYTVRIFSDSSYMVDCFSKKWIEKWIENGWKTTAGKDVLNQDLWELLDKIVRKTKAVFERVPRNDIRIQQVDQEAKLATRNM